MANWIEKIELNKIIADMSEKLDLSRFEDDCPDEVKKALADEIRKSTTLYHFGAKIENCQSIAAVNRTLEKVFSEADRKLVWCGFS